MMNISTKIIPEEFILETPDEEQTLDENLLEDSEKFSHKQMAQFQREQHGKLQNYWKGMEAWATQQLERDPDAHDILNKELNKHMRTFVNGQK